MEYLVLLLLFLTACDITGLTVYQVPEETGNIDVYFCPKDDCENVIVSELNKSTSSIHCAFFDLDNEKIIDVLKNKEDVYLVLDNENKLNENLNIKYDTSSQFSHNKFCIIDSKKILTGSTNPTNNGLKKNDNNLLIINSRALADNYADEFFELFNGEYGDGFITLHPFIIFNNKRIENMFCPEDECADRIVQILGQAEESIHFMTFSFTHDEIGDTIIKKAKEGIKVRGVQEKSQNNKYNEFHKFEKAKLNVSWDKNPNMMHHKTFIIDEKIVITGSMNPTKSGDERNDENILIFHDREIAKQFLEEFNTLLP